MLQNSKEKAACALEGHSDAEAAGIASIVE
jgi:hypothetical protein